MIGEFSDGISENLNPETPLPNEKSFFIFFYFKKVNKIKDLEPIKIVT